MGSNTSKASKSLENIPENDSATLIVAQTPEEELDETIPGQSINDVETSSAVFQTPLTQAIASHFKQYSSVDQLLRKKILHDLGYTTYPFNETTSFDPRSPNIAIQRTPFHFIEKSVTSCSFKSIQDENDFKSFNKRLAKMSLDCTDQSIEGEEISKALGIADSIDCLQLTENVKPKSDGKNKKQEKSEEMDAEMETHENYSEKCVKSCSKLGYSTPVIKCYRKNIQTPISARNRFYTSKNIPLNTKTPLRTPLRAINTQDQLPESENIANRNSQRPRSASKIPIYKK